jgi:hypothetical protein
MIWSCSRVVASMTIIPEDTSPEVAINLLQGDHTMVSILPGNLTVAILGFHEVGIPQMAVVIGLVCGPYSLFTMDSLGHNWRAEW